jgi:hypothetical protein
MANRPSTTDIFNQRLYHYERFCPEWLETTLRSRKIFCANPAALNDPWDCKPCFTTKSYLSLDPARISVGVQAEIERRRIYCLTPDSMSILMWSHYGANHTGICLEFHIASNVLFSKAQGVDYPTEYPEILTEELYTRETVDKVLLTKARCWEYEGEFRLLGSPDLPEDNPLRLHDGYLKLPPLALMSVIVGCKGDYHAVQAIVDAEAPDLRVTQLIRSENQYSLAMSVVRDHLRNKRFISWPPYDVIPAVAGSA